MELSVNGIDLGSSLESCIELLHEELGDDADLLQIGKQIDSVCDFVLMRPGFLKSFEKQSEMSDLVNDLPVHHHAYIFSNLSKSTITLMTLAVIRARQNGVSVKTVTRKLRQKHSRKRRRI